LTKTAEIEAEAISWLRKGVVKENSIQ